MTTFLPESPSRVEHGHRPSHRRLLTRDATAAGVAPIDAIVVPAARHAAELKPAVELAAQVGAPLIVLCSYRADAAEVHSYWPGPTIKAVNVPTTTVLPGLLTGARLAGTPFQRDNDTTTKRNLALAVIRMTGWQRVFFLDDDIDGIDPDELRRAASLLGQFQVVGLENDGFPDNSVVCHAHREVGAVQGTFIGGGAMLVHGSRATSLFPDVYNEDWLFLLDGDHLTSCAVYGHFAQRPFDPYKNPVRAASQEFGDCIGEGLFALLDNGLSARDANREFWRSFLHDRTKLIDQILRRLPRSDISPLRRSRVAAAMQAARTNLSKIEPKDCVDYLAAWRLDRDRWRTWVEALPQGLSADDALTHLEL